MVTLITTATVMVAVLFYAKVPHTLVLWIGENFKWADSKKK